MFKEAEQETIEDESYIKRILAYVRMRRPFSYGYKDIMNYLLKLRCFRLKASKRFDSHYDKGK